MHQENSNSQNFTQLLQLLPLACCSIQGVLSIDADRPMIFDILFSFRIVSRRTTIDDSFLMRSISARVLKTCPTTDRRKRGPTIRLP